MTYREWSERSPTRSPSQYRQSSSEEHPPHPSGGNLYLMMGELIGDVRHLIWRMDKQDEQINEVHADVREIHGKLRDGSDQFRAHNARIASLEAAKITRMEKLIKRWAAYLLPPATGLGVLWATDNLELALRILERLPR